MSFELTELVDGPAGWLIGVLAVAVAVLVGMAFRQGREISFWHPRIGPRPPADATPAPPTAPSEPEAAPAQPSSLTVTDTRQRRRTMYELGTAQEFYQAVATRYDQRNSGPFLATQREVVRRISTRLAEGRSLRVLDLGGGTGREIATHFFDLDRIRWTYVDASPAMAERFRHNIEGTRLDSALTIRVETLETVLARSRPGSADVIVLSFVLSSMARWPDLGAMARLLVPGGILVVADVDPTYAADHPCYEVAVDGVTHALRTRPMRPVRIVAEARTAGLTLLDATEVLTRDRAAYAFVLVLERAAGQAEAPE